jgi:tripartite-type tricarboxylate transporter receptor subunit TctC
MRLVKLLGLVACGLLVAANAVGQDYPSRPLTFLVPYPPGGITDISSRSIAKVLSDKLGQTVIVENKAGAAGLIGTEQVVRSKPDGYTFLFGGVSSFGAYAYQLNKVPFDPFTALKPVHGLITSSLLFVVRGDAPYKTYAEFVEYAKKNPNAINYYTIGQGSAHHLLGEELQRSGGYQMTQVPYKGSQAALADLLGGSIHVGFIFPSSIVQFLASGRLRALAVSDRVRLPILPDVPTFAELGYKDAVYSTWAAVGVPAATPQPVVDKLSAAINEALQEPGLVKQFTEEGTGLLVGYSGEKLQAFIRDEVAQMKAWLERAGVKPQ